MRRGGAGKGKCGGEKGAVLGVFKNQGAHLGSWQASHAYARWGWARGWGWERQGAVGQARRQPGHSSLSSMDITAQSHNVTIPHATDHTHATKRDWLPAFPYACFGKHWH